MKTFVLYVSTLMFLSIDGSATNETIATYDQRQTGALNIRVSVKDMQIIALLGGGLVGLEDYDYNYDYSELTVKPPNGTKTTTPASTTTSDKENVSAEATTSKIVEITPPSPILRPKPTAANQHKPNTNLNNSQNIAQKPNNTEQHAFNKPADRNQNKTEINNNKTNITTDVHKTESEIPVQVLITPIETPMVQKTDDLITTDLDTKTETTDKKVRQADCIEGYRKDKKGVCRPKIKKPVQSSLLRQLIQLSRRVHAAQSVNAVKSVDQRLT